MSEHKDEQDHLLSNRMYNFLKWMAAGVLPAFGAFYFGLDDIWHGLPKVDEVVGTTTLLNTFLGAVLLIGTKSYNNSESKYDGKVIISHDPEVKDVIQLDTHPQDLGAAKQVTLKVEQGDPPVEDVAN